MVPGRSQNKPMQEAFILVKGNTMQEFERAMAAIEESHGRILHSYPPNVITALLEPGITGNLRGRAVIESIDMDEISDERLKKATDEIRMAMVTWNDHLKTRKGKTSRDDTSGALSWGDPSRLPPDPPPHIQERLRRREREMERPKKPGKNKPRRND